MPTAAERNKTKYNVLRAFGATPKEAKRFSGSDQSYIDWLRDMQGLDRIDLKTFGEGE